MGHKDDDELLVILATMSRSQVSLTSRTCAPRPLTSSIMSLGDATGTVISTLQLFSPDVTLAASASASFPLPAAAPLTRAGTTASAASSPFSLALPDGRSPAWTKTRPD